ncbi:MAG: hypothetical protein JXR31_10645 [Prolixibacteraceae bacterium]|nr:hypothetical protein [Prolixibacteraceae bacterium]MBN2774698.1 hypothetical protein [Prolixibacteraceae bacterium]
MSNANKIRLLINHDIDYEKWDECVDKSLAGKLYARSWYLDLIAEGWQALVYDDYEFVMPLPVKSKWGITYLSQPTYCQQTGIFPSPYKNIQEQFADELYNKFRRVSYQLNTLNDAAAFNKFQSTEKTNYILHLEKDYESIYKGYLSHTKRNLKSAQKFKVAVNKGMLHSEYLQVKKQIMGNSFSTSDFALLNRIMGFTVSRGNGTIYSAYTNENNLCAAAFFIYDGNRIYYLNSFSNAEGKKNMAMYSIIDRVISDHAGSKQILDFEGSVIKSIAWFFESFNPVKEKYFYIYSNRIPVIRKFIK